MRRKCMTGISHSLKHGVKRYFFVSVVYTVGRTILELIDPDLAMAASAPWTVTTEYGEVDSLHPKGHRGVDFALPEGTELKSVVEGKVEVVKDEGNTSFGKSVRIRTSDGRLVIYGHLHDWEVQQGEHIDFGEVIGHSGNTGRSTGGHLHFEVRINGKPIDPLPTIYEGMSRKARGQGIANVP